MPLSGIASGAFGLAKTLGVNFDSIFGGGNDCTKAKKQEAQAIAQDLQKYTTRAERAKFIRSTGSSTSRIPATPQGMAKFYIGEDDCKHKNVSQKHKRFINGLKGWIRERKSAAIAQQQQTAAAGSAGGLPSQAAGVAKYLRWAFFAGVGYMLYYLVTQK